MSSASSATAASMSRASMATRNGCMARPFHSHQYELSKRFHVSVANFWSATAQQVYRELDRLEAEGLLRTRLGGRMYEQLNIRWCRTALRALEGRSSAG